MTPARRFPLCPALPGSECRVGGGGRPSLTCYLRPPFQTAHADFPHAAFTGYSPSGGSSSPCLELHGPLPTWSPPCPRGSPQRQRLGHCRSNHQSAGAYSPAPARGSHSRRDPFPLTGAFWATSPPPLIETIPRLSPRFLSTVGHSDFSHDIPGDFAGSLLIRPGTRPVEQDRTRSPGVTRAPSPPCRPHTPCCVQRPKYFLRLYSAGSVAAGLGRPVSPVSATARRFAANPSDPTSRWAPCPAQASSETAALSLLSVSRHSCAQRGVTPAFGYGPRLGRSGWTLTSKDHAPPGAHYQRVRLPPQHLPPFGRTYRWHTRSTLAQDRGGSPRSLDASFSARAVLSDPAGVSGILAIADAYCCLPRLQPCRPPDQRSSRGSIASFAVRPGRRPVCA